MNSITEIWKVIPETNGGYEASSLGNIRSTGKTFLRNHKPTVLRVAVGKFNKYGSVHLWINGEVVREYVHTLVARAFIGSRPDGKEVNHKDGVRLNNKPENLEYVTRSENNFHSYRKLGRKAKVAHGERHHSAKMTWALVDQMRKDYESIRSYAQLARKYLIDWTTVKSIVNHVTWREEYGYETVIRQ